MKNKILLLLFLFIGNCLNAYCADYDGIDYRISPETYVKNIKEILYSEEYTHKITSEKFKEIIKKENYDKDFLLNALAIKAGNKSYNNNELTGNFSKKLHILESYTLQKENNKRIKYDYAISGRLRYIDFLYENYPSYPYYARKYTPKGCIKTTTFYVNEKVKVVFNKKFTTAKIYNQNKLFKKIRNI